MMDVHGYPVRFAFILDEWEKEVVIGRFGLETGGEERTQREISRPSLQAILLLD
jgi:hypothetical protein